MKMYVFIWQEHMSQNYVKEDVLYFPFIREFKILSLENFQMYKGYSLISSVDR